LGPNICEGLRELVHTYVNSSVLLSEVYTLAVQIFKSRYM
jgi:hypothetical protein